MKRSAAHDAGTNAATIDPVGFNPVGVDQPGMEGFPPGDDAGTRSRTAISKARHVTRAALAITAAALLAGAGLAGLNLSVMRTVGQASATLEHNLGQAARKDADLDKLKASQEQTDAQFADAEATSRLQLPQLRRSAEANARTSRALSDVIDKALREQEDGEGASRATGGRQDSSSDSHTDSAGGSGNGKDDSGLSEEQRQQVEKLLQSNSPSSKPSPTTQPSTGDSTNKPW